MSATKIVKLSVGGVRYETTLAILMAEDGSLLASIAKLIEHRQFPANSDGYKLIDRNGTIFSYILDYLRNISLFPGYRFVSPHAGFTLNQLRNTLIFRSNDKLAPSVHIPSGYTVADLCYNCNRTHLPPDRATMNRLRDEAVFFFLPGLLKMIDDHDMNSRKVRLPSLQKYLGREPELRLDQLCREENSALAKISEQIYREKPQVGTLIIADINLPGFDQALLIPPSPTHIGEKVNYVNNHRTFPNSSPTAITKFLVSTAWDTVEKYLLCGDYMLAIDVNIFLLNLKQSFCGTATNYPAKIEVDEETLLKEFLFPLLINIADYFGLQLLKQMAEKDFMTKSLSYIDYGSTGV
uniref:Potassium channel tetramerisation-type BTB domain-containing protein n=1 Tax=Plectus sambesii TaxID=2011161 RepID=A0A914XBG9_9BILA